MTNNLGVNIKWYVNSTFSDEFIPINVFWRFFWIKISPGALFGAFKIAITRIILIINLIQTMLSVSHPDNFSIKFNKNPLNIIFREFFVFLEY